MEALTIRLPHIGTLPAARATLDTIETGGIITLPSGDRYTVTDVTPKGKASLVITVADADGNQHTITKRIGTLIAYDAPGTIVRADLLDRTGLPMQGSTAAAAFTVDGRTYPVAWNDAPADWRLARAIEAAGYALAGDGVLASLVDGTRGIMLRRVTAQPETDGQPAPANDQTNPHTWPLGRPSTVDVIARHQAVRDGVLTSVRDAKRGQAVKNIETGEVGIFNRLDDDGTVAYVWWDGNTLAYPTDLDDVVVIELAATRRTTGRYDATCRSCAYAVDTDTDGNALTHLRTDGIRPEVCRGSGQPLFAHSRDGLVRAELLNAAGNPVNVEAGHVAAVLVIDGRAYDVEPGETPRFEHLANAITAAGYRLAWPTTVLNNMVDQGAGIMLHREPAAAEIAESSAEEQALDEARAADRITNREYTDGLTRIRQRLAGGSHLSPVTLTAGDARTDTLAVV